MGCTTRRVVCGSIIGTNPSSFSGRSSSMSSSASSGAGPLSLYSKTTKKTAKINISPSRNHVILPDSKSAAFVFFISIYSIIFAVVSRYKTVAPSFAATKIAQIFEKRRNFADKIV